MPYPSIIAHISAKVKRNLRFLLLAGVTSREKASILSVQFLHQFNTYCAKT